jgi:hypothetical protein
LREIIAFGSDSPSRLHAARVPPRAAVSFPDFTLFTIPILILNF